MSKIIFKEITDKDIWESFVLSFSNSNFLQSWYWGEFHNSLSHKIYRDGIYKGDVLVGVALYIVEKAKRGKYIIVPGGPLIDWTDGDVVAQTILRIKEIAKLEKAVFVRVRPQLEDTEENHVLFKKLGFRIAPTHLHAELTSELDLSLSEDDLLKNMRKQTRYEIKKGEKLGIVVSETTDPNTIKDFYDIQLKTATRQKFVPFSYDFLHKQFQVFSNAGLAKLYTAKFEDKILAQAFIIFYGHEGAYHYGASTEDGRQYPGAYAVLWKAIRESKRIGLKSFNFWGVAPEGHKNHRFYPISIFKRGFGGKDKAYIHARDLVIDMPRYFVAFMVEYIRKLRRRL